MFITIISLFVGQSPWFKTDLSLYFCVSIRDHKYLIYSLPVVLKFGETLEFEGKFCGHSTLCCFFRIHLLASTATLVTVFE